MTSNCMSSIARKFSSIKSYLLGSIRISRTTAKADYNSIVAGLALWYGVVLDFNAMFCFADEEASNRGRIMKHAISGWDVREAPLQEFLEFLDELSEMLLKHISSSSGFKADSLLIELKAWSVSLWLVPLKGILLQIFRSGFRTHRGEDEVHVVRAIRQISCFLKKLDVARPDLEDQMRKEFLVFETELSSAVSQRSFSIEYQSLLFEMKRKLDAHLGEFAVTPIVPGHGPGAVADVDTKCWYEKHINARTDARIGYLLDHADLGNQSDYLPFVKEEKSDRTSRYICVPKTWKKLRGISSEPTELQFWQQGLMRRIDYMFRHDSWWKRRVDLHDQTRSRDLALLGSFSGDYATVDLSAASDSVTLQLIRDLFGNSHLGRWLLGTRSTHTLCGEHTIQLNKFAPMGSACCFPVECMVFCLAAEVAVSRARTSSQQLQQVCVYGDDIVVPSYAVQELFLILQTLGFSVNTEKSFWQGEFREACGVEAWRGHDIAPCRFKKWRNGMSGSLADYDEIASLTAFANELFARGLHDTRAYLLTCLFKKTVRLGKSHLVHVQHTIASTFSGENQTLASPCPTNFNLERKFSHSLQTHVFRRVSWQERPISRRLDSEMSESYDVCEYITWLVRHQSGVQDFDLMWSNGWIEIAQSNAFSRLPIGTTMVPTLKWGPLSSHDYLS